jgi:hypothetical protein
MRDWRRTWAWSWWVVRFDAFHGTSWHDRGAPDEVHEFAPDEVHEFFAERMAEDHRFWMGSEFE